MAEQLQNALGMVEQGQQAVFGMIGNLLGGGQPNPAPAPAPAQEPAPVPAPAPPQADDDGIEAEWDGEEEDELDDADAHPELHGIRDEGYTGEGN